MPYILGLGALYQDVMLSVPHFPPEDTKLRAVSRTTRLGGNIVNSFEVLAEAPNPPHLPSNHLPQTLTPIFCGAVGSQGSCHWIKDDLASKAIQSYLLYRDGISGPANAYIICAGDTGSRTIISYGNSILDPSAGELRTVLMPHPGNESADPWPEWIHVEGRNCGAVGRFLDDIRFKHEIPVSVDLERPRDDIQALLSRADILFISQAYAMHLALSTDRTMESPGHCGKTAKADKTSHETLVGLALSKIGSQMKPNAIAYLTLGSAGCFSFTRYREEALEVIGRTFEEAALGTSVQSRRVGTQRFICAKVEAIPLAPDEVIESTGAGDVFAAGVVWTLMAGGTNWVRAARNGCQLAGVKVMQRGFNGLWGKSGLIHLREHSH